LLLSLFSIQKLFFFVITELRPANKKDFIFSSSLMSVSILCLTKISFFFHVFHVCLVVVKTMFLHVNEQLGGCPDIFVPMNGSRNQVCALACSYMMIAIYKREPFARTAL